VRYPRRAVDARDHQFAGQARAVLSLCPGQRVRRAAVQLAPVLEEHEINIVRCQFGARRGLPGRVAPTGPAGAQGVGSRVVVEALLAEQMVGGEAGHQHRHDDDADQRQRQPASDRQRAGGEPPAHRRSSPSKR
jgi:hypothetical protein